MMNRKIINDDKLDMRKIKLNELKIDDALFNSGSLVNIITRNVLVKIKNLKVMKLLNPL